MFKYNRHKNRMNQFRFASIANRQIVSREICGQVVQKFNPVVSNVEKHNQDQEKPNSLFDVINEERKRENK